MTDVGRTELAIARRLRQIAQWGPLGARAPRRLLYMIEVTGSCNLRCPVCYASAEPDPRLHLPVEKALARGRRIREDGGRLVQLIGGEPAEHPGLSEIVRGLSGVGLYPSLATNGVRLAEEPAFAAALKRAGLRKVNIQFDTLSAETSVVMRGRDLVQIKCRAVERAVAAGLRVGLLATLCDRNVHEVDALLQYALAHTPQLNTVTFQTMARLGRIPPGVSPVDRPAILLHLLSETGCGCGLTPDDILPPPQYPPWRALTHPDCASLLLLCRDAATREVWPLGRDVDLERFYARLHAVEAAGDGVLETVLRPAAAALGAARLGARLATLQRLYSLATGRGRRNLCVVQIDAVMECARPDAERLRRCPACFVDEAGYRVVCMRHGAAPGKGGVTP